MPRKPHEDPAHEGNSARHHTGKPCIEPGCDKPAGTVWSPLWCQECNAKRIRRVTHSLEQRTKPDPVAALAAVIRNAGGSARLHHPDGVQGQTGSRTGPVSGD